MHGLAPSLSGGAKLTPCPHSRLPNSSPPPRSRTLLAHKSRRCIPLLCGKTSQKKNEMVMKLLLMLCRTRGHQQPLFSVTPIKFKLTQLIMLGLLLAFHGQGLQFLSNSYGYSCLVLSPVMVWCVPIVACMLIWLRYYHIPFRINQKAKDL